MDDIARAALDRQLMTELVNQYSAFMDSGEFDRMRPIFAEDAVWDISPDPGMFPIPVKGRDAIIATLEARYREVSAVAQRRHVTTVTIFDAQSDTEAASRTFLTVFSIAKATGTLELRSSGVYHDKFSKRGGHWQFTHRLMVADHPVKAAAG